MKKFVKAKYVLQIVMASLIATLATAGIVAATTIGTDISTGGALSVTGASTLTGNTAIAGTLNVTGLTTLGNASSTILTVSGNTYIATTTISGGDLIVDTNTLVVDNDNNRVGIGSSTPSAILSVGDASATSTIDLGKPCFRMTQENGTVLYLYLGNAGDWATSTASCY